RGRGPLAPSLEEHSAPPPLKRAETLLVTDNLDQSSPAELVTAAVTSALLAWARLDNTALQHQNGRTTEHDLRTDRLRFDSARKVLESKLNTQNTYDAATLLNELDDELRRMRPGD